MAGKIGEMLLRAGLLSQAQLDEAIKESNGIFPLVLIQKGMISEDVLLKFIERQARVPMVDAIEGSLETGVLRLITPQIANRYGVIPLRKVGRVITLLMSDPTDLAAIEDVKFSTGMEVSPVCGRFSRIAALLDQHYPIGKELTVVGGSNLEGIKAAELAAQSAAEMSASEDFSSEGIEVMGKDEDEDMDLAALSQEGRSAPIINLVNYLMTEAVRRSASDIHMEPYEKTFRIRFRIDGVLHEILTPSYRLKAAITSRIKIMAKLDITERRRPQDGRIKIKVGDRSLDLRVSVIPTLNGEKVVMRLLDKATLSLDLSVLGFSEDALKRFYEALAKPYGILLVTGPTGSGKTTTLYSALSRLNTPDKHILTVEDPVEYNLRGINQVQVNEDVGLTFSRALRAFLRQAPNVLMVGEIRDVETMEIAIRAALTGHLVLSTIHTNDAPTTISRLIDMGAPPFLVSSSLCLIQAQRLVRRICKKCRAPMTYSLSLLEEMGVSPREVEGISFAKGRGCQDCNNTGYRGRVGLYEVMLITPEIREMVLKGSSSDAIRIQAVDQGMKTLRMDAVDKIKQGVTTVEEMVRETAASLSLE
jgi:type IV pilus assembly protein PilB